MEFDYQFLLLTPEFFQIHPPEQYPELLQKESRVYNCLVIDTMYDYYICIPFRTEMHHKNGYKFKASKRSRAHQSGLDYSKIVILKDSSFLSSDSAIVDDDEYNETVTHIRQIAKGASNYVQNYVLHVQGDALLDPHDFLWRYGFSTLKYFHEELGLTLQSSKR